jgi:hypothetical protein
MLQIEPVFGSKFRYFLRLSFCFALLALSLSLSAKETCTKLLQLTANPYSRGAVMVIAPWSSGNLLAPEIRRRGYQTVSYQPMEVVPPDFATSARPSTFDLNIPMIEDRSLLYEQIRHLRPRAIIPGTEPGVILANEINHDLGPRFGWPQNPGLKLFEKDSPYLIFRDKYLQHLQLGLLGLPHIRNQISSFNLNEILEFVRKRKLLELGSEKVVVKPRRSGGTEGVFVCQTEEEIVRAVTFLKEHNSKYGLDFSEIVLQEFIPGTEYVVNTVSLNGRHKVTDIWVYKKRLRPDGLGVIYDYDTLLEPQGALQDRLVTYTQAALDAFGYANGPAHTEIFVTEEDEMILGEMNARMMGAGQPRIVTAALGVGQVELSVDAILEPELFAARPDRYKPKNGSYVVSLSAENAGGRVNWAMEERIKALYGYYDHHFYYHGDEEVQRTTDMATILGQIELVGDDQEALDQSLATIRAWEEKGLFQLLDSGN